MRDDFDRMLTRHLTARPEIPAPPNLARLALAKARQYEERHLALQRLARQVCLCSVIAGILLLAILAFSLLQWPTFSDTTQTAFTSSDSSDTSALSTWGILLAGVAALALWRAMGFRDDRLTHPI